MRTTLKTGLGLRASCASTLPSSYATTLQWPTAATKPFGSAPVSSLSKVHVSFSAAPAGNVAHKSPINTLPARLRRYAFIDSDSGYGKSLELETRGEERVVSGKVRVTCVPFPG